jgi:MFS family permease
MVALDLTIVVVALPHIQVALGFSGSNLEWVVNAYAVTFGWVLLLGGRAGDLLGRRRILIAGLLGFSLASLAGRLATGQAWPIAACAVQGAGAAMAASAALSLVAEALSNSPLLPVRVLASRNRSGACLVAARIDGCLQSARSPSTPAAPAAGCAGRCWTTPRTGLG